MGAFAVKADGSELFTLAVFALTVAALIYPAYRYVRYLQIADAFRALSRRKLGRFRDGALFSRYPSVEFSAYNLAVAVTVERTPFGSSLVVRVEWPDPGFWCEIVPNEWRAELARKAASVPVEQLYGQFSVYGSDREKTRAFLSLPVRERFRRLLMGTRRYRLMLALGEEGLVITKGELFLDVEMLEVFVQAVVDLCHTTSVLQMASADEIQFIEEPPPVCEEPALCQICGEEIYADEVRCRDCDTPHHRECWEYNGQCSTYACGQSAYYPSSGRRVAAQSKR